MEQKYHVSADSLVVLHLPQGPITSGSPCSLTFRKRSPERCQTQPESSLPISKTFATLKDWPVKIYFLVSPEI